MAAGTKGAPDAQEVAASLAAKTKAKRGENRTEKQGGDIADEWLDLAFDLRTVHGAVKGQGINTPLAKMMPTGDQDQVPGKVVDHAGQNPKHHPLHGDGADGNGNACWCRGPGN